MSALNIHAHFRSCLVAYKLAGEVGHWWDFIKSGSDIDVVTLEEFEELLFERFFNEMKRANKVVKFMNLK